MLRDALLQEPASPEDAHAQARMREMHDLIEQLTQWFDEVSHMDAQTLSKLMKMGAKVGKLLDFTGITKRGAAKPASTANTGHTGTEG